MKVQGSANEDRLLLKTERYKHLVIFHEQPKHIEHGKNFQQVDDHLLQRVGVIRVSKFMADY